MELPKIEIKLKECCLTCGDFDPMGISGIGFCGCSTDERVIGCGHRKVCWKYLRKTGELPAAAQNGGE